MRLLVINGSSDATNEHPEMVALAKKLHRRNPKTGERKSLRLIAAELAGMGHLNIHGGQWFHTRQ